MFSSLSVNLLVLTTSWLSTVNPCTDKPENLSKVFELGVNVGCAASFPLQHLCDFSKNYEKPSFHYYYPLIEMSLPKKLECFMYIAAYANNSPIICMCSTPGCNKWGDIPVLCDFEQ
ncbi:hypothetical protein GCK32_009654 [Trichostrongylus colubriformis]|uniref:Uncharacterized protein n=1 Tax=Trichostrongylus colubriformis TaxID=6319 RepID=A0AAN8FK34_TRICO